MLEFFVADPDSDPVPFLPWIRDSGSGRKKLNPSSVIRDKHPGSATQMPKVLQKGTCSYNLCIWTYAVKANAFKSTCFQSQPKQLIPVQYLMTAFTWVAFTKILHDLCVHYKDFLFFCKCLKMRNFGQYKLNVMNKSNLSQIYFQTSVKLM